MNPGGGFWNINFGSDSRKKLSFGIGVNGGWNEAGGWNTGGYLSLNMKPSTSISISTGPDYFRSRNVAQYVKTVQDPAAAYGNRYVFADLDQAQVGFTTRVNWILSPRMSLQVYSQPLISIGDYWDLKEISDPRGFGFSRYGIEKGTILLNQPDNYRIDPDGDGPASGFDVANPDFNFRSLKINAVFRWEWRLGSTLYFVWSESRSDSQTTGNFAARDLKRLFAAPANDIFLVRLAYWFGK